MAHQAPSGAGQNPAYRPPHRQPLEARSTSGAEAPPGGAQRLSRVRVYDWVTPPKPMVLVMASPLHVHVPEAFAPDAFATDAVRLKPYSVHVADVAVGSVGNVTVSISSPKY